MKAKFILYALAVTVVTTVSSWSSLGNASTNSGSRNWSPGSSGSYGGGYAGSGGGSTWSSHSRGGYSGGFSGGGGHK